MPVVNETEGLEAYFGNCLELQSTVFPDLDECITKDLNCSTYYLCWQFWLCCQFIHLIHDATVRPGELTQSVNLLVIFFTMHLGYCIVLYMYLCYFYNWIAPVSEL